MPISSTCYQKLQIKLIRKYGATSFDVDAQSLLARSNFLVFRQLVCGHESPEHHQFWHQQLNTGVDSKCLKGIGGKHTLILSPRGAAKSTFLVEWTAWVIGVHSSPSVQIPIKILYTSYNIEVASLKSEQIQAIITSPAYRKVFPWVRPGRKWGSRLWEIDKAHAGLPMVDEPYTISCAGIKGAVASKRAHLCCVGNTQIETRKGLVPISDIYPGMELRSFNHETKCLEWKPVKAIASRLASDLYTVRTETQSLECTSRHPIYVNGKGYKPISKILLEEVLLVQDSEVFDGWATAPVKAVGISSFNDYGGHQRLVYDIEVEDNHNFFANGILVHNCVLDDLVKSPSQIENPKVRDQMDNTWVNVIRPVIFEGGRAVCLGTRMSGLDLYATTFTEDRSWNVIEQSAIVEDDLGEEQSYWPSMVSFEHLDFLRTDDPTSFALQYQNKIPKEGMALIRQAYMPDGVPPTLEEFDSLIISSDFSASIKSQADYSVFLLLGKKGKDVWVLDIRRGRWQGNIDKCNVFLGMLLDWGFLETEDEYSVDYRTGELEWLCYDKEGVPRKPVIKSQGWFLDLYTESQSYQISFRSDWTRYMHDELGLYNLTCRPVAVRGDKMQRLVGVTGYFQSRRIWFNSFRANTLKKVKQELEGFGFTAKDDCVDALVLGVNCLGLSSSFDV